MDFELETVPEAPPRPAAAIPEKPQPVLELAETTPIAAPPPQPVAGPDMFARRDADRQEHRRRQEAEARRQQLERTAVIVTRVAGLAVGARALVAVGVLGTLASLTSSAFMHGVIGIAGLFALLPLARRWRAWVQEPARRCATVAADEAALPAPGDAPGPDRLVAEARLADAVRLVNDAMAESQFRWRVVEVQLGAAAIGGILVASAGFGMKADVLQTLVLMIWGGFGFAALGWLAVVGAWGAIRVCAGASIAAPVIGLLAGWTICPSTWQGGLFTLALTVMLAVCGGMLLGWWIEHLDTSSVQRNV